MPGATQEQVLFHFQLVRQIGQGAMGVVYEAIDQETGQRIALKTLRSVSPKKVASLKKEFRSLASIHHPSLLSLGELYVDDSHAAIAMELVDGTNIVEYTRQLTDETFDEHVRALLVQLASGLDALHRQQKIHCDIKPSNLLVTLSGRLVIVDFGLVTELGDFGADASIGIGPYLAPERIDGSAISAASDWYSVGVVLYEVLTGKLPPNIYNKDFDLESVGLLSLQNASTLPTIRDVPIDLKTLCLQLLEHDMNNRAGYEDIIRVCGPEPIPVSTPLLIADDYVFIGREKELALLHAEVEAFASSKKTRFVYIDGESGVGKSALLKEFVRQTNEKNPSCWVLSGRCNLQEIVPFGGLDGIIDSLNMLMSQMRVTDLSRLIPENSIELLGLFPALQLGWAGLLAARFRLLIHKSTVRVRLKRWWTFLPVLGRLGPLFGLLTTFNGRAPTRLRCCVSSFRLPCLHPLW